MAALRQPAGRRREFTGGRTAAGAARAERAGPGLRRGRPRPARRRRRPRRRTWSYRTAKPHHGVTPRADGAGGAAGRTAPARRRPAGVPPVPTERGQRADRRSARPAGRRPELVETLRTHLQQRQDRRATARRLGLHPNSVDHRLARVQELTGLDLADPRSTALALAALLLRETDAGVTE
ncbi:helix-turn-helix domain-containing protein [Streptomyces alanosinicus]|uniref:helix-turn-helix domain-containing protein n=1 Tax=Streptomyces alanosinicus TaxID=68171 RepID=UPI001E314D4D|nr:helix-turn-helix domain-containing protein [Streptomyces alanosinicus]